MIFELKFTDGRIVNCTAKDIVDLIKSYDLEFDLPIQEIESITEVSEDQAKVIQVRNTEFNEPDSDDGEYFNLFDLAVGDDFKIIASTEFD